MIEIATDISFGLLGLAALFTLIRIARGPTLADRILGLEILSGIGAGFVASYAVHSGLTLYADVAIVLPLLSFLATAALARYLLSRQQQ